MIDDLITLNTINKILEPYKKQLKASQCMIYINCLTHHFKEKEVSKDNLISFEIKKSEFGNYNKFIKTFKSLMSVGLVKIYNDKIVFLDVWSEHIPQEKLITKKVRHTKKDIPKRMEVFKFKVFEYSQKYSKEILEEFYLYWTEHGEHDRSMRFEKQKSFNLAMRLQKWRSNNYNNHNIKTINNGKERTSLEQATEKFISD